MKERLQRLAADRPILFVLGCLLPLGLYLWAGQMADIIGSRWAGIGAELFAGLVAALILTSLGWWRRVGFTAPRWRMLWVIIPYLIYMAGGYSGVTTPWTQTLIFTLDALLVGFQEEAWMRGIFLETLRPRFGAYGAVIISSLMFGLLHLAHLFSGVGIEDVLLQVLVTLFFGLIYAGIRLRTGSIWVPVLLHAVLDLFSFVGSTAGEGMQMPSPLVTVIMAVLIIGYGVALLWGVDKGTRRTVQM